MQNLCRARLFIDSDGDDSFRGVVQNRSKVFCNNIVLYPNFKMSTYQNILILSAALVALLLVNIADGLECYVCTNQENNVEKCLNTIKTCEQGEDMCLSETKWGSTPYWSQGAEKQYYISKRCATNATCVKTRKKFMPYCTHIWYEDWKCSDCCQGDRCNYYVILSGSLARSSVATIVAGVGISLLLVRRLL